FEVAEGDGTAATLAFLRKSEAEHLRGEIMDRAAGREPSSTEPVGTSLGEEHRETEPKPESAEQAEAAPVQGASDRLIVRVPLGRLIGSVLAGVGTIVLLILGFVLVVIFGGIAVGFAAFGDNT